MGGKKTYRREIISETQQLLLIAKSGKQKILPCDICGGDSLMISPALLTQTLGISERKIFRFIEAGRVHFVEDEGGKITVCLESLNKDFARKEKLIH